MPTRRIPCTLLAALTLAGCTVGPNYKAPQVEMPPDWVSPTAAAPAAATQPSVAVVQPPADIARWWSNFGDPELESLVQRSLESNLDLRVAALRLRQAREAPRLAAAGLWPRIAAGVPPDHPEVRSLQRQRAISRENLASQQRSLELTRKRFQAGFETGLDTANAESLVFGTQSQIPLQEASLRQSLYALAVLLG